MSGKDGGEPYYAMSGSKVLEALESSSKGLEPGEVKRRWEKWGADAIMSYLDFFCME